MNSNFTPLAALACAVSLAAFHGSAGDKLSFHVPSGSVLARSFESRQEVSQDDVEMLLNGQPIPAGTNNGMTLIQSQSLEIVDEFTAVEGSQPKSLKRSFQKIASSGEQSTKNPMDAGEQEDTQKARSELEGKTVVFEWDAAKSEFKKSFAPEGPEEKLLSGLVEDVDFRGFLPASGQASAEDSWQVDVAAMSSLFLPGGNLSLKPVEGPDGVKDGGNMNMFESNPADAFSGLEGEVKATYKGSRDVDGVPCGVIALDFKVHSTKDLTDKLPKPGGNSGPMGDVHVDHVKAFLALEGEGELIWDLGLGCARSLSMSAKIKNQMEVAMKIAQGDKSMDILRKMQMSGSYDLKVAVAKR